MNPFLTSFKFLFPLELAGAGNTPNPHQRELKLIQSLDDIRHPQDLYKAEEVTPPDISS